MSGNYDTSILAKCELVARSLRRLELQLLVVNIVLAPGSDTGEQDRVYCLVLGNGQQRGLDVCMTVSS